MTNARATSVMKRRLKRANAAKDDKRNGIMSGWREKTALCPIACTASLYIANEISTYAPRSRILQSATCSTV